MASGLDINGCVLSYFEGTANLHCYTSCALTTLHCSKVSFLQCCHMKRYNKVLTKMWGVYSLLWDTVSEFFMFSVSSVSQYRWPEILSKSSFTSIIILFFHLLQEEHEHSVSFSACFLTDLHCRKSFLVQRSVLVNVTVEINRHEQCDSHDPASIPKTFLIWCSPWYEMMMDSFLRADESPGLYLCLRSSWAPLCRNPPVCLSADGQILSGHQKRRENWRDQHLRL